MNDDRLGKAIGGFYRETDATPPDSRESARQVRTRLPQTPQVRSRRWLPPWQRGHASPADTSRPTESESSPIPATNGHTPTVIGRTQSMFSPVKAITAGVIVAALGGVMLISQPFEQRGSPPGAEGETTAPTWVTGSMQHVENSCSETGGSFGGGVSRKGYECTFAWTSSDPRLTGDVSKGWNEDTYQTDDGPISVAMDASYLRNEGGDWACSTGYLAKGSSPDVEDLTDGRTHTCVGSGGYEGLSAVLVSKPAEGFSDEFVGMIFSGEPPPVPEVPAAE